MDHDVEIIQRVLERHVEELERTLRDLKVRLEIVKRERRKHEASSERR
jgi:hypothetical protein